jgi:hypothetical protein
MNVLPSLVQRGDDFELATGFRLPNGPREEKSFLAEVIAPKIHFVSLYTKNGNG